MLREGRAFWLKIGFLTHCKNGDLAICLDPSKQLKLPSHLWHCRSTKVQSFRCVCDNIVNIAGIVHLHQILLLESQIITVPRKGLFLILNMHTQTCDSSHNFFFSIACESATMYEIVQIITEIILQLAWNVWHDLGWRNYNRDCCYSFHFHYIYLILWPE